MKKLILLAALLAPLASRAQEPQKLTLDFSGWVVWNSFRNQGEFDARELPRYSQLNTTDEKAYGMAVRQSRLRLAMGIPTDGWFANATLKGFVEADFMGGSGADVSTSLPRLRHYYVSATWKQYANLTLLVGQFWGVAPGPYFASSLTHLAVPRFAGAGFLYRRAPEVRLSIDAPAGDFAVLASAAALTPGDFQSPQSNSPGNLAAFPDLEARIAGAYRPGGKQMAEVGVWSHYGREKYEFTTGAAAGTDTETSSEGFGVDVKFDLPYVSVLAGAFMGSNIDGLTSIAGLRAVAGTASANDEWRYGTVRDAATGEVYNMDTEGAFAQLIVTPIKGFQLVGGVGFENPQDDSLALPGATPAANTILRNNQYSGGVILNVTSKWRISAEFTRYVTFTAQPARNDTFAGNQFEIGSLLAL